ncbi:helix-turn-helix domain-containing protein [Rhodococcus sp. NBC_00294]|uniref:helix-turn-helix domain-containing protein n=1 Tax=Rhodococcus sp. NBC_00294 TaxID=2976004 RepID=UPI003FA6FC0C
MCYSVGASGIVSTRGVPSLRRRLRGFAPEQLRARRLAMGLSGAEVARLVGVASSTYSQWERGQSHPRIDSLARCAEELGRPISDFVFVAEEEEYLGDLRTSRGLTQGALANEVGVSPQYIGALERGQSRLGGSTASRVAEVLRYPVPRVVAAYERVRSRPRGEPA